MCINQSRIEVTHSCFNPLCKYIITNDVLINLMSIAYTPELSSAVTASFFVEHNPNEIAG